MTENESIDTLYIPAGLKTEKEIYSGFGKSELIQAVTGATGIAVIDILFSLVIFNNLPAFIIILLMGIFASVMCVQKDITNLSVLDMAVNLYKYMRSQKTYYYKAIDEWRWNQQ
ncbi:hypothetical protein LY28_03743 [Ruminiclostridium sufflavum DSM 19573]|uniref:PrgI family protein n=1 Tax=Ruminiclostridium sufflavum DSM 19573 TaxID=1121337 RepID=A0A318XFA8_9FIRM|nr:hypothetical protein [Ruminiclostridium sufflavum]PYG84238.1 hypothetical protein LY28_03743 [Ruminiclostridium sufflavum DSM 19573]